MGRRILLTGATSGIGQATLQRLLDNGDEVWATARSREDLQALDAKGAHPVELDLTQPATIEAAAAEVDPTRELDGLVHNAGIGVLGAVEDLDAEGWRQQFEVNLLGPIELTRHLAPALRAAEGRIVLVSSLAGLVHLPYYGAYCASKHALEVVGDTLRLEMGPAGVGVCLVEPGPVATEFQSRSADLLQRHVDVDTSVHRRAYAHLDEAVLDAMPAVTSQDVARAIEKGLTARRAPTRIPVGRLSWLAAKTLTWLPDRLQDRVLRWIFPA